MIVEQTIWGWRGSVTRTVIYTLGHIIIASLCNYVITGAPLDLAAVDAIIEPIINGFWYFGLDYFWTKVVKDKN